MERNFPDSDPVGYRDGTRWTIECPWSDEHTPGLGDDATVTVEPDLPYDFKCWHAHCAGRDWRHLRERFDRTYASPETKADLREVADQAVARQAASQPASNENAPAPTTGYGEDIADFIDGDDADDGDAYIVDGLVPEGVPMVIAGAPKARKSWIMYVLAIGIAAGQMVLGRQVRRGRVLIIGREDSRKETRRRIRRLARGIGVDPRELRGWLRVDVARPLRLDCAADVDALRKTIDEFKPAVVFIDCLKRVHSQNENSASEMSVVTNAWADLCSGGTTVALVHHLVKTGEGPLLQRMRGTGDLAALVRFAIGVDKTSDETSKVETDGNLPGGAEAFSVRFHDGGEAGGPLIRVEAQAGKDARPERALTSVKERVVEELGYGPMSGNAICRAVGGRKGKVLAAVEELQLAGRIFRDPGTGQFALRQGGR